MSEEQKVPGPRWVGNQKRKRYNVVLDPSVKEDSERAAKEEGLSLSMWLENAARKELKRIASRAKK